MLGPGLQTIPSDTAPKAIKDPVLTIFSLPTLRYFSNVIILLEARKGGISNLIFIEKIAQIHISILTQKKAG
ncbi:hypothetical protein MU1_46020 [Paenibacillus glycanilyticus]|uniref:Uncharacterized protein n=1 Tax=Paenibacillus glycanilyticus TaxID=126569 RepID=A0ABQ6GLN2_9BACL|nr:hypothetical protein MU1_46020 [Paenibacillus glycanilyticus]